MSLIRHLRALAVTAAIACSAPAFAQAPAPAQPAATPIEKLTPAHIALGKEVVMLSGVYRTFNVFVPSIMQQIFNTVTPTRPEIRKDLDETLRALIPVYEKRTEEMIDQTAKLFASVMSEDDLKGVVAFFKSPAGKQYVEMQPRVIDQMVLSADEWNRKLTEEIMDRVRADMKKKGKDF